MFYYTKSKNSGSGVATDAVSSPIIMKEVFFVLFDFCINNKNHLGFLNWNDKFLKYLHNIMDSIGTNDDAPLFLVNIQQFTTIVQILGRYEVYWGYHLL